MAFIKAYSTVNTSILIVSGREGWDHVDSMTFIYDRNSRIWTAYCSWESLDGHTYDEAWEGPRKAMCELILNPIGRT